MRVLLFGTYDAAAHPRVAVLADGLRAHGIEVEEVNVPLGLDTAARVAILRQPWRLPVLAARLVRCWAGLVSGALRAQRRGPADAVLVGYLGHFDVLLARRLFPRTPVVLDHLVFAGDTAADRGETGSVKQQLLRRLDRSALSAADVVVLDTEEHRAEVPPDLRARAVVVPVGAPEAWLAPPADQDAGDQDAGDQVTGDQVTGADRPLSVVFFGLFTPLQGAPVIADALALLARRGVPVRATMIGSGQERAVAQARLAGVPGITWRDWVPAAELPAVVAAHEVCLGVFGTGPKALRVVPNKVYQGAAAGCAIVTSDTSPQRRALGEAALLVPPGDPTALADALGALAADRGELARLRRSARRLAGAAFTPAQVVTPLLDRLPAGSPHRLLPSRPS